VTIGAAPSSASFLDVTASTTSFENGGVLVAPFGSAQAFADLSILVQEFSPTGVFIRNIPGPSTVVLDARADLFGVNLRVDEIHTRIASIHMPVVGGRIYRIWLDSFQFVNAVNTAHAASNFTYDFGPLFFVFT